MSSLSFKGIFDLRKMSHLCHNKIFFSSTSSKITAIKNLSFKKTPTFAMMKLGKSAFDKNGRRQKVRKVANLKFRTKNVILVTSWNVQPVTSLNVQPVTSLNVHPVTSWNVQPVTS